MDLTALRKQRDGAQGELDRCRRELDDAHNAIMSAGAGVDTAPLKRRFDAATEAFDDASHELTRCKGNVAHAQRSNGLHDENPQLSRASRLHVRVGRGPLTYGPETEHERSFFADAYAFQVAGDPSARERLEQHGRENLDEMRDAGVHLRDVGTGAFAGLTVPQYLIDQFAPLARAGSPTLNLIARKMLLPSAGMTVNVSRITTGAAAAVQASENAAVQETDMDDTLLTVNVRTYAGQQDVSRQAIERSAIVDSAVYEDLTSSYFTVLDAAILNADGTGGTHLGIRSTVGISAVTYTDASPTVAELYPKLADAIRKINAAGLSTAKATAIIMHSSRWGWGTAALDTATRPLFAPEAGGAFNPLAVGEAAGYGQVMGRLLGLPVITDDNILTTLGGGTEDTILVVSGANLRFWSESGDLMPRQLRFEQVLAPQTIRCAVWGYSAFTAGCYPAASAAITGTGLAAQAL